MNKSKKIPMNTKELLASLEKDAKRLSNNDIMKARSFMLNYVKFLPEKYKKAYSTELFSYYYETFMEIKGLRSNPLIEEIDVETYKELIKNYDQQVSEEPLETYFQRFMNVVTPYLIFITKKPLHPVGMILPGGMTIMETVNITALSKTSKRKLTLPFANIAFARTTKKLQKQMEICGKSFRY